MHQTRGLWQGLAAPFVSSYTEAAKAICSVGLSAFVGKLRWEFISPEMENLSSAEAVGLWGNGDQSQLNTIPGLYQFHWVSLHLDDLLCTQLHAVRGWLLKSVISQRECQGVLTEALPQPSIQYDSPGAVNQTMLFLQCCCNCHMLTITLLIIKVQPNYIRGQILSCLAWFKFRGTLFVSEPTLPLRKGTTNVLVIQTPETDKTELLPFI